MATSVLKGWSDAYNKKKAVLAGDIPAKTEASMSKQSYRDSLRSFGEAYKTKTESGYTPISANEVQDWLTTSSALGKQAVEYYGKDGWKSPNTTLLSTMDSHLKEAPKVRHYFKAKATSSEISNSLRDEVEAYISGLETLHDSVKQQNTLFSQFENADAFNEAVRVSEILNMDFKQIDAKMVEINQIKEEAKALEVEMHKIDTEIARIPNTARNYATLQKIKALGEKRKQLRAQWSELNRSFIAYTSSDGRNVMWQQLYDTKKQQEDVASLYAELSSHTDWAEKSQYVSDNANGKAVT